MAIWNALFREKFEPFRQQEINYTDIEANNQGDHNNDDSQSNGILPCRPGNFFELVK